MGSSIIVEFRAVKRAGDGVDLFCKMATDAEWPETGREYANWKQLLGTMSEILARPEGEFNALRSADCVLSGQVLTSQQLKLFGFPNLDMTSAHPSYQGSDASIDDI